MHIADSIELKQTPLGVPYLRENDPLSHGYINLRQNPEMITLIPELRDCTPLRDFIIALNSVGSPFETFGCEKWFEPWACEQLPGYNMRFGSYVDIAFLKKERCVTPDIYYTLVNDLREYAKDKPSYGLIFFELTRTFNTKLTPALEPLPQLKLPSIELPSIALEPISEGASWWTLSVYNYGVGRDNNEAKKNWAECVLNFRAFLNI